MRQRLPQEPYVAAPAVALRVQLGMMAQGGRSLAKGNGIRPGSRLPDDRHGGQAKSQASALFGVARHELPHGEPGSKRVGEVDPEVGLVVVVLKMPLRHDILAARCVHRRHQRIAVQLYVDSHSKRPSTSGLSRHRETLSIDHKSDITRLVRRQLQQGILESYEHHASFESG